MKWLATSSSRKLPVTPRRSPERAKRPVDRAFQAFVASIPRGNKGIGGNKRRIEQTATNQADTSNIKATGVAGAGRKLLRCGIANLNP
jgi:hypothetical protein